MRDWNKYRQMFVLEGKGLPEIARETGVSYGTLRDRARRENWRRQREEGGTDINRVAMTLLERIEGKLREDALEAKDFKSVSGALKELSELQAGREKPNGESTTLTVSFVGETEEMSR